MLTVQACVSQWVDVPDQPDVVLRAEAVVATTTLVASRLGNNSRTV
jgi:hypothetical protein